MCFINMFQWSGIVRNDTLSCVVFRKVVLITLLNLILNNKKVQMCICDLKNFKFTQKTYYSSIARPLRLQIHVYKKVSIE